MLIGLFSDVHAYPRRLERAIAALDRAGAERLFCLGDLVGYGPEPLPTLELVASLADLVICGNHDDAAIAGRCLPGDWIDWLRELPLHRAVHGVELVHASLPEPERFRYAMDGRIPQENGGTLVAAREVFAAIESPVLFAGHTHVASYFVQRPNGRIDVGPPCENEMALEPDHSYVIDVGSVSLPRQGARATAVLLDTDHMSVRWIEIAHGAGS